jgi:hypothetical protein
VAVLTRLSRAQPYVLSKTAAGFTAEQVEVSPGARATLPRITYSSALGIVLAYAYADTPAIAWKTGATWNESRLATAFTIDAFTSDDDAAMAVSAATDGTVHLVWRHYDSSVNKRSLRYTTSTGAAGFTGPTSLTTDTSSQTSLGISVDPEGTAVVGYRQTYSYARRLSGGSSLTFMPTQDIPLHTSSAVGPSGQVHFLAFYYDGVTRLGKQNCAP